MQKTETLRLNTWVLDDPVSLEEMNENFLTLDAEAARMHEQHEKHTRAEALYAYHLAHRALEQYHNGKLYDHTRNLLLIDFSKSGEFAEVSDLNLAGGKKPTLAQNGYNGFQDTNNHTVQGETLLAEFVADGNGTLTKVEMGYRSGYEAPIVMKLMEGETELGRCTENDRTAVFQCELYAGHTYRLYGMTGTPSSWVSFNAMTVTVVPHNYESGHFTTKVFPVSVGGDLHLWLAHQGQEPNVALKINDGSFQSLTCRASESAKSLANTSVSRREYRVADVPAGTVQLKITLSEPASMVEELCGIVQ